MRTTLVAASPAAIRKVISGASAVRSRSARRGTWRVAAERETGWRRKCGYPDLDIQLRVLYRVARKKDACHTADGFERSGGRGRRRIGPIAPNSIYRAEVVRPSRS